MRIRLAAVIGLTVLAGPALADSRDAAKDRMDRCEQMTETRPYLDCLYAALQPLRNDLGLPPAPQATTYAPLFASAAPPRRASQSDAAPRGTMGFIDSIISGDAFINAPKVAPEQFGLKDAKPGRGENVDHIVQPITNFKFSPGGIFEVTLANGEVWAQQPYDDAHAKWKRGDKLVATIAYGASGTFNLTVDENSLYKVHRIK